VRDCSSRNTVVEDSQMLKSQGEHEEVDSNLLASNRLEGDHSTACLVVHGDIFSYTERVYRQPNDHFQGFPHLIDP